MSKINWKDKCWVSTIYLVRSDNKVLLTWNKNMNTWIPVGGHVDEGEIPDEAVAREVQEETGFEFEFYHEPESIDNGNVRIIKPYRIQVEKVPHHNYHINMIFFGRCTRWHDKKTTDEDEKLRWFSYEELVNEKDTFLKNVWDLAVVALQDYRK